LDLDRIGGNELRTVTYRLRLSGMESTTATLRYISTRGGVVSREFTIGY
jgi:hypothetical protein